MLTFRLMVVPVISEFIRFTLTMVTCPFKSLALPKSAPRPLACNATLVLGPVPVSYRMVVTTPWSVTTTEVMISLPMVPEPLLGAPKMIALPLRVPLNGTPPKLVL